MTDNTRIQLALFFLFSTLILPCMFGFVGWLNWDTKTGLLLAGLVLGLLLLTAGLLLRQALKPLKMLARPTPGLILALLLLSLILPGSVAAPLIAIVLVTVLAVRKNKLEQRGAK